MLAFLSCLERYLDIEPTLTPLVSFRPRSLGRIAIFSNAEDLYGLLEAAVIDGGLAARGRVEAVARDADDLLVTFPAYAALMAWGAEGMRLIVGIALTHPKVKSKSAALTLFSIAALDGKIASTRMTWVPPSLQKAANAKADSRVLRSDASQALRTLILSLPMEDLMIPISQSVLNLMDRQDVVERLVTALGVKWLRFGPPVLDEYSRLIAENPDDEPAFQAFFCRYPQLLDPMAVQVWSQPDFHGALEPDFVVRRADDSYLVVEIECPGKLLMTKGAQLSGEATHAENQAIEYESFLSERVQEARTHFPKYRRADCLVVIGTEAGLDHKQSEALERAKQRRQNVRIVGFDRLEARARALIENVSHGTIDVVTRHRMI